jgi:hypothetical protein
VSGAVIVDVVDLKELGGRLPATNADATVGGDHFRPQRLTLSPLVSSVFLGACPTQIPTRHRRGLTALTAQVGSP